MIIVISSSADGPVNFNPTGPAEDQTQKLISSTAFVPVSAFEQDKKSSMFISNQTEMFVTCNKFLKIQ